MMRAFAALMLVGVGCAGGEAMRNENTRMARQIEELRRRTDGDRHTVHELENRVFILEDKLDTAQVALGRSDAAPPRLPVVTKTPPKAAAPGVTDDEPSAIADPADDRPPVVIKIDGRGRTPARAGAPLDHGDLDAIDEKLPVVPLPKHGEARPARPSDDAMDDYQRAYQALTRREHGAAIAAFRAFVAKYPNHDYADNAQYWLGEAYYDQADYQTALVEFRAVLKHYPAGNKAPDALLKVGFCLTKLGDAGAAGDVLGQVVEIYPKTDAAKLAMKRLDEIRRVSR